LNISRVWSELIAVVKAKSGCFRRPRFVASALLALGCCLPLTPVFAADRAAISLPAGSLSVALRHLAESTGSEIVSVDPAVAAVRVPARRVGSDPARVGATAQGNRLSRGQDRCAWFPDRTGAACARASARGACQFPPRPRYCSHRSWWWEASFPHRSCSIREAWGGCPAKKAPDWATRPRWTAWRVRNLSCRPRLSGKGATRSSSVALPTAASTVGRSPRRASTSATRCWALVAPRPTSSCMISHRWKC
jgi:hypothetical protein